MGTINLEQFNFINLFYTALLLIAIYFLLLLASRLLPLANSWGAFGGKLQHWVEQLILIFEPLTLILIVSHFVMINPLYHGIIIAILLLIGISHVKNYFNGRILLYTKRLKAGQKIKVQDQVGIVSEMDRLGLSLKTNKGIQTLGYSKLFEDGFMIMSGDDIGGYYYLVIKAGEGKEVKNFQETVLDFLATVPYLDHNHSLSLQVVDDETQSVKTTIIVKEESHLNELLTLVKENGFECKISKK